MRWGIEKWPQESRTTNLATNGVGETKRGALSIAFELTCPAPDNQFCLGPQYISYMNVYINVQKSFVENCVDFLTILCII